MRASKHRRKFQNKIYEKRTRETGGCLCVVGVILVKILFFGAKVNNKQGDLNLFLFLSLLYSRASKREASKQASKPPHRRSR